MRPGLLRLRGPVSESGPRLCAQADVLAFGAAAEREPGG